MHYADLTVQSGEQRFYCHRAIVSRCCFFDRACRSDFKESRSGIIEMHNDPPYAVRALLQFLYTHDYDTTRCSSIPLFSFHAAIYVIADKYNVPSLKSVAAKNFSKIVEGAWVNDEEFQLEFLAAIEYVYRNTMDSDHLLRDISAAVTQKHASELLRRETARLEVYEEGQALLESCPEFAADLAAANPSLRVEMQMMNDPLAMARRTMLDEYLAWTSKSAVTASVSGALYDSDDEQEFI